MLRKISTSLCGLFFFCGIGVVFPDYVGLDHYSFSGEVQGIIFNNVPLTESLFDEEISFEEKIIDFQIIYQSDDELEWGKELVIQAGEKGIQKDFFRVSYWQGEEISRTFLYTEQISPVDQIVAWGKKKVWRVVVTPEGEKKYYQKRLMLATSYDGFCPGCSGITFTGTTVKKGVCAVDPRVIPLGSWIYVDGYGLCHAEDIGGAIKGDRIDLGFSNVQIDGFWSTRWTNVYLLDD